MSIRYLQIAINTPYPTPPPPKKKYKKIKEKLKKFFTEGGDKKVVLWELCKCQI